jgi:predicted transcriptional regulator
MTIEFLAKCNYLYDMSIDLAAVARIEARIKILDNMSPLVGKSKTEVYELSNINRPLFDSIWEKLSDVYISIDHEDLKKYVITEKGPSYLAELKKKLERLTRETPNKAPDQTPQSAPFFGAT